MALAGLLAAGVLWWVGWPAAEQRVSLPTLAPTVAIGLVEPLATATAAVVLPPTHTPIPSPTVPVTSLPAPTTEVVTAVPTETPNLTPPPTPDPAITPTATAWVIPTPRLTPGEPQPYLTTYRLVTFYGSGTGPGLGILGDLPREQMVSQLRLVAAEYQALDSGRAVVPTFHIVSTVADAYPGEDGSYSHQVSLRVLEEWIALAEAVGAAVILDIQPGYADILAEFERVRPLLGQAHVHLALDPEFVMAAGEIPGYNLGQIGPEAINAVQAALNEIALDVGLNKVLIIHQFDPVMVLGKEGIEDYPYVELVFDADGFGAPAAKLADYEQYAAEPGFEYGGLKLFYGWDFPLMTAAEVMAVEPQPAIIVYQ